MNKRVIFLDIDGCLNSERTTLALHGRKRPSSCDIDIYLDPIAIALLKRFTAAGVLLVISSSHRIGSSVKKLSKNLGLPVHSMTPIHQSGWRANEIRAWLEANPTDFWVAVDDDIKDTKELYPNIVHIGFRNGMQLQHFRQMEEILQIKCLDL